MPGKKGHLPISRVYTIMKSSSDADLVTKESSVLMCRAAELFIQNLARESYENIFVGRKMDYKHVTEVVHSQDRYIFLREMIPKKITFAEYKKIMEKKHGVKFDGDKNDKRDQPSTSVSSSDSEADSSSESSEGSSASA